MINSLSCPQKEKNKGQHTMTLHPYKVIKPSDLPLPHTTLALSLICCFLLKEVEPEFGTVNLTPDWNDAYTVSIQ